MDANFELVGGVLDSDFSHTHSFTYEFEPEEQNLLGNILEYDLSVGHIEEEPILKHFHPHIIHHDLNRERTRIFLKIKNFFNFKKKKAKHKAKLPRKKLSR